MESSAINLRRSHRQIRLNSGLSDETLSTQGSMFRLSCLLFLVGCASAAVALFGCSRHSLAHPLENFSAPLSIMCGEGQRECSGVLRVDGALGGHTGISIVKGRAGEVSLKAGRPIGSLRLEAEDATDVAITFSWDGDSNPEVLSGSGLNCFDLTQQGAYAFIISKFSVESDCSDNALDSECPNFIIDSRVYDSQDPTGQRFSASTIVRGRLKDADLAVPFSNFVRHGPRGKGSFTCAGAVILTFRFRGLEELELQLGPMFTNGREGLQPLPTPVVAPTATPAPVTTMLAPLPSVTAVPTAISTITSSPPPVGTAKASPAAVGAEEPTVEKKSSSEVVPSAAKTVGQDAPAEAGSAMEVASKSTPVAGEVIYGSVVIGQ